MQSIIHLLNEIGMLSKTPRSGYAFLGTGSQSVAEHSYRMALVGYALARMSKQPVDVLNLILICLFHDVPEARTGDLNYVNKRYVKADEAKVVEELKSKSSLGETIAECCMEYQKNTSIEAHLAHDADKIEMLLVLKEQHDIGNPRAMEWFENVAGRVLTEAGKSLVETIRTTRSDGWWLEK